jgi:RNA ligase (TIGR02306 family)
MTLASIQRIISVEPIPNADRIERVKVLGWDCVARKGIFKLGDLCVYIEIDSLIPKYLLTDNPEDKELIRLKTVKLKKQLSQGLVLDLESTLIASKTTSGCGLSDLYHDDLCKGEEVGYDLTEYLGIKKYEKEIPAQLQGLIKGNFPSFIVKTDEVRIQSEPKLLELLKGKPYYISQKMNGTSATYYKLDGKFGVCSRNIELKDGENVYWKIARKYNIEDILTDGYTIQGEICGPNIQKNQIGLEDHVLYVFNYIKIKGGEKIDFTNFGWINPPLVPILEKGNSFNYTLEELIEMAKGTYPSGELQEGIVVRSLDQTISFKVLNNDYLLKEGE